MRRTVRFAVVGEGRDEHGFSAKGPSLRELPAGSLQGALVTLVSRLLRERFGLTPQPVAWSPPRLSHLGADYSPSKIVSDVNYLPRLLDNLFCPIRMEPHHPHPLDLVVLSVDSEYKHSFTRACRVLRPEIAARTISLVFEPELEVLLVQGKEALEDAYGIPRCQTKPPAREGNLKARLEEWRGQYAPKEPKLDAAAKTRIAGFLKISPGTSLEELAVWTVLTQRLEEILT